MSGKKFYVNKPHRLTDYIGPNTAVIIFRAMPRHDGEHRPERL